MTMLDLPWEAAERHRVITSYLTTCRVAALCRAGDRVVELGEDASALLPLLLRRAIHPHSLTVLHDVSGLGGTNTGDADLPFPVSRRVWDESGLWPVAGPFDLAVAATSGRTAESVLRVIENAAALLTLEGRLALTSPATMVDLPDVLHAAGFIVEDVHGVELPTGSEQVERLLLDRFGDDSIALFRAMARNCEPEFVQPVVASSLADGASTVLRICRRTR
ncbi:hypothetical protein [Pseudonocardia sp. GCM10023141]|uniref:hypothetical protein n=1 Tax=Pseudonocardia sp. GCM10023141 TaxID=3252653 RepID=UPI00361B8334